jgi:predicted RNase H-like HicB family nuclease
VDSYAIVIFYSDEDECYVADIPDLRYCSAISDTPEEALAEALIAKRAWLESSRKHGDPIPEPFATVR